jgi:hypothetical protein
VELVGGEPDLARLRLCAQLDELFELARWVPATSHELK